VRIVNFVGMSGLFDTIAAFYRKHRVWCHIAFWLLVLFIGSLELYFFNNTYQLSFGATLLFDFLVEQGKIPTTYFVVYGLFPLVMDKKRYVLAFVLFFLGTYFIFVFSGILRFYFFPLLGLYFTYPASIGAVFLDFKQYYTVHLFSNLGGAAGFLLVKLIINHYEVRQKAILLEKQKTEIELKLLKTQLNPHFLFNTLNNIYALSLMQSTATSAAIARLSEILDYILYRCNTPTVPLSKEVVLLENYIALEKLRYDERLKVHLTIDIEVEIPIAPLLLLSIVENAFKHGAGEEIGQPLIDISLATSAKSITFKVENSYSGHKIEENRAPIGLQNLKHQLEIIYPEQYDLQISQTSDRFIVQLNIYNSI
jgi:sensor histidine kinase YesM